MSSTSVLRFSWGRGGGVLIRIISKGNIFSVGGGGTYWKRGANLSNVVMSMPLCHVLTNSITPSSSTLYPVKNLQSHLITMNISKKG